MSFLETVSYISDHIWYVALVMIVALGIYATVRLRGLQFRGLREMCRVTMKNESRDGRMTPMQVFFISMANRIGVGNIAGPVLAILTGGPGAIFWMWVFATIGMATSFLETTVGQLYKEKKSDGEYRGGPAYSVKNGLGMKRLAVVLAVVMMMMYCVGFISMEVSTMSDALKGVIPVENIDFLFAIIMTAISAFIMLKGVHTIGQISIKVVPAMAVLWVIFCSMSIVVSYQGLPSAVASIFTNAFSVPAAVGGGLGTLLIVGMQRGVLSNEAGVGTITNISSMADTRHPAAQGLSQSLGVLMDTVVCTLTALVVLSFADIDTLVGLNLESMDLINYVFTGTLGTLAPVLIAGFIFIFAYTSMLGDFVISGSFSMFLKDSRGVRYLVFGLVLVVIFLASMYSSDSIFAVVDLLLAVCGIINVYIMFRLGGKAVELYRNYKMQREQGVDEPVFTKDMMEDPTGVTEWDE